MCVTLKKLAEVVSRYCLRERLRDLPDVSAPDASTRAPAEQEPEIPGTVHGFFMHAHDPEGTGASESCEFFAVEDLEIAIERQRAAKRRIEFGTVFESSRLPFREQQAGYIMTDRTGEAAVRRTCSCGRSRWTTILSRQPEPPYRCPGCLDERVMKHLRREQIRPRDRTA